MPASHAGGTSPTAGPLGPLPAPLIPDSPFTPSPSLSSIEILHADAAWLVCLKPSGLLAVPGRGDDKQDCLSARVQRLYPEALVVHRLDQATSGLMLMARSPASQRLLSEAFAQRQVHKRYVAVVSGQVARMNPPPAQALESIKEADGWRPEDANHASWQLIDLPIAVDWPRRPLRVIEPLTGKPSQTRWRIAPNPARGQDASGNLDEGGDDSGHTTRLELEPLTGRSHQLRVHLQALGHPILGDALYASPAVAAQSTRLLLHATLLGFTHPVSGERLRFESLAPF